MSTEPRIKSPLQFGVMGQNGIIRLSRFCLDPSGSGLKWFESTGDTTNLGGLLLLDTKPRKYRGICYDTGEFYSHAGELLHELLQEAPEGTTLAVFKRDWSCGTRTFVEEVTVKFYGKISEEAKAAINAAFILNILGIVIF